MSRKREIGVTGSRRAGSQEEENWEGRKTEFGWSTVVRLTKQWIEERTRRREEDGGERRRAMGGGREQGFPSEKMAGNEGNSVEENSMRETKGRRMAGHLGQFSRAHGYCIGAMERNLAGGREADD